MANFNKAFNFRGGFQVDEDVFIVRGQQVGIGSTIPTSRLDVVGTISADGLEISGGQDVNLDQAVVGMLTATTINVGVASINAGVITATSGIVTYYGDGRFLEGLPTSQWVDVNVGLGFTSIYAAGYVGVDTNDPRYPFQVGGTPFANVMGPPIAPGDGVGIEDGNLYASGILSTRSDVRAQGTIFAETEFVGVGSNITILNADNLGVGSIGSMRYGNIITTKEVYADRFIGTATSAESIVDGAVIDVTGVVAQEIDAKVRFISTEGYLQIGTPETVPNNGDIEVNKGADDATIYGISTSGTARILVGEERLGSGTIAQGGLQKGISPGNISGPRDLDLINFDTGNLNYYLHGGASGTTTGSFRWINGQNSSILAELSQFGNLKINRSLVSPDPALDVTGESELNGKLTVSQGGMDVTGISSFQDNVEANGDLIVNGAAVFNGDITLSGNIGISTLLIGIDPNIGGQGTLITENSAYLAGILNIGSSSVVSSQNITAPTFIGDVSSNSVEFITNLRNSGSSFSVNSSGLIQATDINSPTATITNLFATDFTVSSNFTSASIASSGSVSGNTGNFTIGNFTEANVTNTIAANLGDFQTVNSNQANLTNIESNIVTVFGTLDSGIIETGQVLTDNLNSTGIGTIQVASDIEMSANSITADEMFTNTNIIN